VQLINALLKLVIHHYIRLHNPLRLLSTMYRNSGFLAGAGSILSESHLYDLALEHRFCKQFLYQNSRIYFDNHPLFN